MPLSVLSMSREWQRMMPHGTYYAAWSVCCAMHVGEEGWVERESPHSGEEVMEEDDDEGVSGFLRGAYK